MDLAGRPWIVVLLIGLLAGCSDSPDEKLRSEFAALEAKAEQGVAIAQFNLGLLYYHGEGVQPSFVKAEFWFRKAAEQGVAHAEFNLGSFYHQGIGVLKNEEIAVSWYRMAANQGYDMAQYNLGVRYANGEGLEKDKVEAYAY